jgi:hypothetical protein
MGLSRSRTSRVSAHLASPKTFRMEGIVMQTKDGAALRKRREMAGFSLEDIQELIPSISYARLSRVEREPDAHHRQG